MKHNREQLLKILSELEAGIDPKGIIEHSACFVFTGEEIRTYNDQVAARVPFVTEFVGAVEAEKLLKLINGLPTEEITLAPSKEGNELLVTAGKAKAGLTIEATQAGWLETMGVPEKWKRLPSTFVRSVKGCLFSAAKDMTRPVLTCVHLYPEGVESCDNLRATRYLYGESKDKKKPMTGPEACVPANAAETILNHSPNLYAVEDSWIHFSREADGSPVWSVRLFGAEDYPTDKIAPLFNVPKDAVKVELPEELNEAVERAGVFAHAEFTQDQTITVSLGKDTVTLKGKGPKGWYEETTPCSYKGKALTFDVHPALFLDMIEMNPAIAVGENTLTMSGKVFSHVVALVAPAGE